MPSENNDSGVGGGDGDTTQGVGGRGESGELQEDGQLESSGGIRLRLRNILAATKTQSIKRGGSQIKTLDLKSERLERLNKKSNEGNFVREC